MGYIWGLYEDYYEDPVTRLLIRLWHSEGIYEQFLI